MPLQRRYRFIYSQLAWMLVLIVLLAAFDAVSLEAFFLVSLLGLLIVTDLTAPLNVTPRWRKRLRWVVLVGLVVFSVFIVRFVRSTIPPEAF